MHRCVLIFKVNSKLQRKKRKQIRTNSLWRTNRRKVDGRYRGNMVMVFLVSNYELTYDKSNQKPISGAFMLHWKWKQWNENSFDVKMYVLSCTAKKRSQKTTVIYPAIDSHAIQWWILEIIYIQEGLLFYLLEQFNFLCNFGIWISFIAGFWAYNFS